MNRHSVIISDRDIVHILLDVANIKDVSDLPHSLYNKKQAQQSVQRYQIFISGKYHDSILDKIERRD